MKNKHTGIQFAALAIKRAKLNRCYVYDQPFYMHVCEALKEKSINVTTIDEIEKITSALSICESEKKSICFFIPQKYLFMVEEAKKISDRHAKVFVMICDEEGKSTLAAARALNIPLWITSKPSDIYTMIVEAAVYSQENKTAAVVAVAKDLMMLEGPKDNHFTDFSYAKIIERARINHGEGRVTLVTSGNVTEKVLELIENVDDVRVVEARALLFWRWHFSYNTTFIMPALHTITSDEQRIRESLGRAFNRDQRKQILPKREETVREREYSLKEDAGMCSGCIFRIKQSEYLDSLGKGWVAAAQEIYCRKRYEVVYSGMKRSNVVNCKTLSELELYHEEYPDVKAVFFTNCGKKADEGIATVDVGKSGCVRRGGDVRFLKTKCDACGACIKHTGCPSITVHGFIVNLSTDSCTGCGLCMKYCKRKALC